MIALIPMILEILLKLAGYFFAKAEEKNAAEKDLTEYFRRLDKLNSQASDTRDRYAKARARMGYKNT